MKFKVLDKVDGVEDLRKLNINELKVLAQDVRKLILHRVGEIGGHLSSNLGVVEATLAIHYVFDTPKDKLVFDVSHQSYTHKIITGRKQGFIEPKKYNISGFTNKEESEFDIFNVGHTSTSISLATGLAQARDRQNENHRVIAFIGDGSLSGGEAFEGLNNAGDLGSNFIVIINDNEMSIAGNKGAIYKNLYDLRESKGECSNNYFKCLGFDYVYLEEGNDVRKIVGVLNKIKDSKKPIVVHLHTLKGNGYPFAVEKKEKYHNIKPFDIDTGKEKAINLMETYSSFIAKYLGEKIESDKRIVVINSAISGSLHLVEFREKYKDNYIDVGIAEEHAVAMASGMAEGKMKPVILFVSSFMQRTFDQMMQDLCLNDTAVKIIVECAGIDSGEPTHVGMYDIPMISNIPGLTYMSPRNKNELKLMIDYMLEYDHPIALRVPSGYMPECNENEKISEIDYGRYDVIYKGQKVALMGLGKEYELAEEVKHILLEKYNIDASLINPRFITNIDKIVLDEVATNHDIVVTIEDGVVCGGWGEKISRYYTHNYKDMYVLNFGAKKEFVPRIKRQDLCVRYKLTPELIVEEIMHRI